MHEDLATRRTTYTRASIDERTLAPDPFAQFGLWLAEALAVPDAIEPNAMSVSTVGEDGRPSARIVLLRAWDERGFVFYSNYDSRKGREIAARPFAALLFWWGALERQVRIEGRVVRVSDAESDAYFARRPRGHQLSAWASPQSRPIARDAFLAEMAAAERRFPATVPRPPHWGGFRIEPDRFEFWQGRPDRAHDRIVFERAADAWATQRLGP